MSADQPATANQKGFTLVEILVTIMFAAILAAVLFQFLGSSMTQSATPIALAKEGYSLNRILEKITAHHKKLLVTDADPLATFKTHIENGNNIANTPYFGEYTVQTSYITLNGGIEAVDTSGDDRVLKTKLTVDRQSITVLFTQ
jgi:prepilin-type N-terminal cleavage/methylation domain-containing protein